MDRIKVILPDHFPFSCTIPLRISDINYGGHLGNDSVLSIVHEARVQFLRSLGYTEMDIEGAAVTMTNAAIEYIAEGLYGDTMKVEVGVAAGDDAICDFVYRLTSLTSGKLVARVRTGIVFLNRETKKIIRVPTKFRERLSAHL